MKKLIIAMLLLCPALSYAESYSVIKVGDTLNFKTTEISDDESTIVTMERVVVLEQVKNSAEFKIQSSINASKSQIVNRAFWSFEITADAAFDKCLELKGRLEILNLKFGRVHTCVLGSGFNAYWISKTVPGGIVKTYSTLWHSTTELTSYSRK